LATHVSVAEQHVVCMHVVQVSLANEMPEAFRSQSPPVPDVDGAVVPLVPLDDPLVSGSGPFVGVDGVAFDAHARSIADASRPTPHDIIQEDRMLPIKHVTCPSTLAVFAISAEDAVDRASPSAILRAPGPPPRPEICSLHGGPGSSPPRPRSGYSGPECACASASFSLPSSGWRTAAARR
jgi:hypothetical protein